MEALCEALCDSLPLPIAAQLAITIVPKIDEDGSVMCASADDEATSGLTTYTDD